MDNVKLIRLVKQHEYLYNKYNKDFKNLDRKKITWQRIAREMGINESECIRRWTNLRDKYTRESRRMTALVNNDMTTSQIWPLFDDMDFLRPHIVPRSIRQTVNFGLKAFEESSNGDQETYIVEQDDTVDCKYVNTESFEFKGSESPISEHEMEHEEVEAFLPTETHSSTLQSKNQIIGQTNELKDPHTISPKFAFQQIKGKKRHYQPDVENEISSALEMFKQVCGEIKTTHRNPAVQGFGQMIVETISSMSERKQAFAMQKVTEIVMNIKMEEAVNKE
ncbi:transcription factor Adf-1 [Bactrocera oleae]|uniref:transcription factor Adf-1 n=1 Tax=Bactrocera oleae TaxID=104688 RepID=UPI00174EB58A|nr:transcription factor Adf-1 isoform X1 [Bactrocera oleae]XP_036221789.1 transcription factor Adf-1 isoform X1 [Bactrocera oleae]XP_036221790.1 transcription factor Adf-1 isoform X1 [Bactrocera oleae]XP_036221791.1 transcription factor Adf-1 isoform X1 [Bactrocera oleae]XP_036221792.1 transcription factor Adf-1 isoform X1 [Bactrocera oleae]XP_036221794.1 transcription factor Adf-1 isoform X1 [Bactrocera oleae]XP_036221796.1 transcription factor Adf-1 isoform X1 [Bactrocera oleae]